MAFGPGRKPRAAGRCWRRDVAKGESDLLPKRKRLSSEREINAVLSHRQYEKKTPLLYLVGRDNRLDHSRLCVVASKKLGKAVLRNKVRRRFARAFSKISYDSTKKGMDLVLFARSRAISSGLDDVTAELRRALLYI